MHISVIRTSVFFLISLFLELASVHGQSRSLTIDKNFAPHPKALNFYLFGDWGRDGKGGQKKVSDVMNATAKIEPPRFIISTGDNFYPSGVRSTTDKQWKTSFEDIYTGEGLQCPWYVVLGNHDYRGNPQAEIDYSQVSKRWNMPARYYVKSFPLNNESSAFVDFVFIDTSPLNDEKRGNVVAQDDTRQLQWIDSVLRASKATWKFVVGHHSMYTGGKRVDNVPHVRNHLENIFIKNNVDLYLCGHEHDLQYIKPDGRTTYLVSGAGSKIRPTGKLPSTKFAASVNGFMVLSVTANEVHVNVLDADGKVIYHTTIDKTEP
jgi:3',5'-cyclic AMP phosphodiesterase CpdA